MAEHNPSRQFRWTIEVTYRDGEKATFDFEEWGSYSLYQFFEEGRNWCEIETIQGFYNHEQKVRKEVKKPFNLQEFLDEQS